MPISREDYEASCGAWAQWQFERWLDLYDALSQRTGWHFEAGADDDLPPAPAWCYGQFRACRLIVTINGGGEVSLLEHAADKQHSFLDIGAFLWWLGQHESEYVGKSPVQEQLLDDLSSPEVVGRMFAAEDDEDTNGGERDPLSDDN